MAKGYLGETPVDLATHPVYGAYTAKDWALHWIGMYGQIDGGHHKAWALDQASRILHGTPVIAVEAAWEGGQTELRFSLGDPSPEYLAWVEEMKGATDEAGEREYDYDTGIAP